MRTPAKSAVLGLVLALVGCHNKTTDNPNGLSGSGSTFVYPMMVQWASAYEKEAGGCKIHYRSLGSGGGIQQMTEKKVDFGCTDAPMTDQEMAKAREIGGEVVHIPLVMGAVVAAYNLPDIIDPVRFTGPVLADIFLGNIKKWNDDALQKLNPGLKLPDQEIVVVHRKDDSGTTYIWSDYLSKVSPEWQQKVGKAHNVKWPTGQAEVGNDGVAKYIQEKPGSLGYVELSYAYRKELAFGLVRNREGEYVKAGLKSTTTAAKNSLDKVPDDLRVSITDAPGKGSYPICGTTFAVVHVNQPGPKGRDLAKFLRWILDEGQEWCEGFFYARLPEVLVSRAKQKLDQMAGAK